ncbi:PQQ-binding-like beta-propeller repeat protein [Amycolatopsis rhabdoformis]|uniref:PQQ-binding-like beta-propeller repeat protein n=1 Tax=Amycolatopsis rhabdoformis TaxID=1448059 RepID=A0ABZ1HUG1_9PSEU|nr:PQQ-binding-like beta-propeller repeat protein [Amycolatopsis rhabdoformis]WSE26037.1 PQQ-binding-like beta-propeller repeat protein [Amycolatopsis rhabdoformis]
MFERRWERDLHQRPVLSDVAVADGHLVVHERSTRLVSLAGADGAVRWDVPLGTWPRAVVADGADVFALPQLPGRLCCLSASTGEPRWTAEVGWLTGHVAVGPEVVLVGGWRGDTPLRALDRATGSLLWSRTSPTVLPAWFDGGFLVGRPGGRRVELVNPGTGAVERTWRRTVPDAEPVFDVSAAGVTVGGRPLGTTAARITPLPRPASGERVVGSAGLADLLVTLDNAGHLECFAPDGARLARTRVARRAVGLRVLGPGRIAVLGKGTVVVYDVG